MAKEPKTKLVAFRTNSTIPARVLGLDKDKKVEPGKPIRLPTKYADHVVADGFAEYAKAETKAGGSKKANAAAQALKDAQQAVVDAQLKVDGLEEGADGYAAAQADLSAAQEALAKLQPSS